jgi:hypothetical protein
LFPLSPFYHPLCARWIDLSQTGLIAWQPAITEQDNQPEMGNKSPGAKSWNAVWFWAGAESYGIDAAVQKCN